MTSKWQKHRMIGAILWGLPLFASCAPPDASDSSELDGLESDIAADAGEDELLDKVGPLTVHQAESATGKSGSTIATKNTGYTGSGYINFGGNGTWMEWNNVNVATAGNYTLTFRYATAKGPRQTAILINGTNTGNVPFESTGSVTTWKTASITKALKAGNNTIRVLANTSSGGPNLDKMEISSAAVAAPVALPYSMAAAFACSTKACTWTSDAINIQGVSNVVISANARADQYGQLESSDYLKMSYRIDGGSWVTFFDHVDDLAPQTVTKAVSASGKQLQVMITALTSSSNETYSVSSLTVAKPTSTPQTGWQCNKSYYGTGDGCDCSCGAPDPDCNGGGCTGPGCSSSTCKRYHAACPAGSSCFLVPDAFGGKWKDVEKDPRTDRHDDLFCWVAGPSNILDWSGWGQAGGLKTTDDIFLYSQNYWPPNTDVGTFDAGDDAYDFLKWFFVGDRPDEDFPAGGGFYPSMADFYGYCNSDTSDPYVGLCPGDMASDSKAIMKVLNAGFAAAIQLKGDVGGVDGGHVITLWGYSVDKNNPGLMTGVFLTDSDDDEGRSNPPDRLFHRKVTYSGGIWHILAENGAPYKYIKFVYGVKKR